MPINIVIAEDHLLVRQGIVSLLQREADFRVVGEAEDGGQAIELVGRISPDILILDVGLPVLNGIGVVKSVRANHSSVGVVAISDNSSERTAIELLEAGAKGYLTRSCPASELVQAIRQVHAGHTFLSPSVAGPVLRHFLEQSSNPSEPVASGLSAREREVLQLVAEGKSSKDIATILHISLNTVIRHRQNITDKLGLNGVAELTRYAIREGISPLD